MQMLPENLHNAQYQYRLQRCWQGELRGQGQREREKSEFALGQSPEAVALMGIAPLRLWFQNFKNYPATKSWYQLLIRPELPAPKSWYKSCL
jgi:hypothetical protein